jgi:hypothetical protein
MKEGHPCVLPEMKSVRKEFYKQVYTNKADHWEEMADSQNNVWW